MKIRQLAPVAVASIGGAFAYLAHRRRLIRQVPVELRHSQLYWPRPILGPLTLALARRRGQDSAPLPDIAVTRSTADGIPVYRYERLDRLPASGVLLWLHGGGRVAGRAALDHRQGSCLARETGYLVISADYRLAPDNPFPAALDDVFTVLGWIHRNFARLGVDPGQVVVAGASAGGGLAAEACREPMTRGSRWLARCWSIRCWTTAPAGRTSRVEAGSAGHRRRTGTPGGATSPTCRYRTLPGTPSRPDARTSPVFPRRGSGSETSTCSSQKTATTPSGSGPPGCRASSTWCPGCTTVPIPPSSPNQQPWLPSGKGSPQQSPVVPGAWTDERPTPRPRLRRRRLRGDAG